MRSIPILLYHSVADTVDARYRNWAVTPSLFSSHMTALAEHGYSVLGVSSILNRQLAGLSLPEKFVVLTFDDGLQDFYTGAFPILERHRFQATLYVVAGRVNGTSDWLDTLGEGNRPMLTAGQIRDLHDAGIEIGAHSMTHPELDVLDTGACANEIRDSRRTLEDILDARVLSFAYPHGYASPTTRQLVREAGFQSAVRVRHALSNLSEDRFGLSRLNITPRHDRIALIEMIEGRGVPVAPAQDRIASTCWRYARRVRKRLSPRTELHGISSNAGGLI